MNQFILRVYNPAISKFTGEVPGYYDLDVDQNSAEVKATLSTVENQNLGRVFGLGTQNFSLPGTEKNNEFFDYTDNPGVDASPFVFKKVYDAEILVNGARVSKGKLYYNGNNTNAAGALFYNVNYTDTIPSLADIFGELRMGDLPWLSAGYDHAFNFVNIQASWDNSGAFPLNGAVKYPNAFYGYEDGENYRYDLSGNGTSVFNQGSQGGRLLTANWKPAVRLTNIMDLIFTGSILNQDGDSNYENNLSISSSFLDGNFQFGDADANNTSGDLYILPSGDGKKGPTDPVPQYVLGIQSSSFGDASTLANNDVVFFAADEAMTVNSVAYEPTMEITQDTNNQWGLPSSQDNSFTCKVAGNHTFNFVATCINLPLTYHDVKVQYIKNNSEITEIQTSKNAGISSFTFDDISTTLELAVDDEIRVALILVDAGGGAFTIKAKCALEIVNNNPQPDVVFMDYQWGDLKVIDFIKGLQHMFNLVFWTDYDEPNVIKIEPYNDWLAQGTERDWSDKVDHSSGISVAHPSQEQAKEVVFDYAEGDGSDHEYVRKVNDGKQRGYYKYISDSDYQIGVTEDYINPVFVPTTMNPLDGAVGNAAIRNMTIPIIRQIDDGTDRPFAFKPRILFNNGVKEVENGQGTDRDYTVYDPIANIEYTTNEYLQMSPLTSMEYIDNAGIGVQFASLEFMPAASYYWNSDRITEYQHQATQDGLFNLFYARQYNNLYRNQARKVTMNLMFEPQDITEFRLNDLIFIDGQKYRINKISGFDFIRHSSCEVELIKELQPFNSPVFTIGNNGGGGNPGNPGPTDPSNPFESIGDEFVFEGDFSGTNFDVNPVFIRGEKSGSIVSASFVQDYQPKQLGIMPSSGSRFYSKLFSPAPNISDPVVGGDLDQNGNTIPNEASTTTVALGDNNVFNQGTSKNAIVGDANSVGANTTDTQIVGDNNVLAANTEKTSVVGADNEFTASLKNALVVATGSSIPSEYDDVPFESLIVLGQKGELPTEYANEAIRSYYYTDTDTIEGDTQVFLGSSSIDPNLASSTIIGTGPLAGISGNVRTQPGGVVINAPTIVNTPKLSISSTGADVFEGQTVAYRPPFPSMIVISSAGATPSTGLLGFNMIAANTLSVPQGMTLELISINDSTDAFQITFDCPFYYLGILRSAGSVIGTTAGAFKYIKWISFGGVMHEIIRTDH